MPRTVRRVGVVLALLSLVVAGESRAAGSVSGTVQFNGRVEATAVPTCSYDAVSLSVPIAAIDFDKIPTVAASVRSLATAGLAPGGIVSNGQAVKDLVAGTFAVNGGYGNGSVNITCRDLSAPFVVRTRSAANDGATSACGGVGCSYLKIRPAVAADTAMADSLALAMFVFAPLPGLRTLGAGWVDLGKTGGFTAGGLSSDGAFPMLGSAETAGANAARTLEFGFLLLRRGSLSAWAASKNTRSQVYTSAIQMSLVYQ